MKEEDFKDMVISHDKDIVLLATSIESLAENVGSTNTKLDDVIEVITQQNVLVERINNLDSNVAESFTRAWHRLDKLEHTAEESGCKIAKDLHREREVYDEKIKVINKRIAKTEEATLDQRKDIVSGTVIRWALGLLMFYSITFGTYVVTSQHSDETKLATYVATDTVKGIVIESKLDTIISDMKEDRRAKLPAFGPRVDSTKDF